MKNLLMVFVLFVFLVALAPSVFENELLAKPGDDLSVKLVSPKPTSRFPACADIPIVIETTSVNEVKRCYIYHKGGLIKYFSKPPFDFIWEDVPTGIYDIYVKVKDSKNNEAVTDTIQIFVDPIEDGDLIKNGEFTGNLSPWTLGLSGEAQATFTLEHDGWLSDSSMALIEIQNPGTENWHVMIIQPFPLKINHTYELSFMADVLEAKNIGLDFQNNGVDWTVHYWQGVDVVSGQFDYGPFEFFSTVEDPRNEFKIALSGNSASIFLDAIKIVDTSWEPNLTDVAAEPVAQPEDFRLLQNYPNPFNASTRIQFSLEEPSQVVLAIYNIQGQLVNTLVDERMDSGSQAVAWHGLDQQGNPLPSGVYPYKLITGGSEINSRMVLLK